MGGSIMYLGYSIIWQSCLCNLNISISRSNYFAFNWPDQGRISRRHQVLCNSTVGKTERSISVERCSNSDILFLVGFMGRSHHARQLQRVQQQHPQVSSISLFEMLKYLPETQWSSFWLTLRHRYSPVLLFFRSLVTCLMC